jgi:hypothetical protein
MKMRLGKYRQMPLSVIQSCSWSPQLSGAFAHLPGSTAAGSFRQDGFHTKNYRYLWNNWETAYDRMGVVIAQ